jgi:hypothetical protein
MKLTKLKFIITILILNLGIAISFHNCSPVIFDTNEKNPLLASSSPLNQSSVIDLTSSLTPVPTSNTSNTPTYMFLTYENAATNNVFELNGTAPASLPFNKVLYSNIINASLGTNLNANQVLLPAGNYQISQAEFSCHGELYTSSGGAITVFGSNMGSFQMQLISSESPTPIKEHSETLTVSSFNSTISLDGYIQLVNGGSIYFNGFKNLSVNYSSILIKCNAPILVIMKLP